MDEFENLFLENSLYIDLAKQITDNNFGQTHIVVSPDEFSNFLLSKLLAKTLICSKSCYCKTCEECIKLESNTHPDLKIISKPKGILVPDVEEIIEDVYKCAYSFKKVYIIKDIDIANIASQNKLLKILEEPPKNVFFILTACNISSVLTTILSRSIKINVLPFDFDTLKPYFNLENKVLNQNSYEFGGGYLGTILAFDNDKDFQRVYNYTVTMLTNIKKSSDIILYSEQIKKDDMNVFLKSLQLFLSDILYIKTGKQNFVKSSFKDELMQIAEQFSLQAISVISGLIVEAKAHLLANANYSIVKDNLLLGILEAKYIYKD